MGWYLLKILRVFFLSGIITIIIIIITILFCYDYLPRRSVDTVPYMYLLYHVYYIDI